MTDHPAPVGTKEALELAARQFREYEAHHRDKLRYTPATTTRLHTETVAKVERNRLMAEMCEQAAAEVIAPPTPISVIRQGLQIVLRFSEDVLAIEAYEEINKVFDRRRARA